MGKKLFIFLIFLSISACTWVELTTEGEKVRVLDADEVTKCKHVGQTSSMTAARLVGVGRHDETILQELTTLARNSAIELGGDTIVPQGEIEDGKQRFQVYRCVPQ